MAYGRWLGDFEPLSDVERRLVEHCARGTPLTLGDERPQNPSAGNKIRAGILRFLLLGGDDQNPAHENGVMVEGAWIESSLDLRQARCRVGLVALECWFDDKFIANEAKIPELRLIGSSIPGLMADGIRVEGDLFLRQDFTANGEVRIPGAEIGGDLDCSGGTFSEEKGKALHADRIKVKGGVFLRDDVIIPFVDLHQEADWGPVVTNESGKTLWWGRVLRWIMWFEIIFGWIASVMFVAIIGRLVDKD